jgi:hypothetical protein
MDETRKQEIIKAHTLGSRTEEELKVIAKDLYNNKIFSDRHLSNPSDLQMVFMVMMFMGPKAPEPPKYPVDDIKDKQDSRANAMYDVLQRDADQKKYEEDLNIYYPFECECYRENFLGKIGFVYEYLDSPNVSPRGVNGYPCFFSVRFLNKEDTAMMFEFYEKYKAIREQADSF